MQKDQRLQATTASRQNALSTIPAANHAAALESRTSVACDATDRGAEGSRLGNTANSSSRKSRSNRQEQRTGKYNLREWARKVALHSVDNKFEAHRVALCGYATATGVSGVGVRVSDGVAGFAGLQTCGSVWACPLCAAKIAARRAEELGEVLGWARREGHTLAMVTMTVSHKRKDALKDVWDAVSSGWGSVTSGGVWNNAETEQEYVERLAKWEALGLAHDEAKHLGQKPPRAPRGWHKRQYPEIKLGDKAKYGVLGWARAVEVTEVDMVGMCTCTRLWCSRDDSKLMSVPMHWGVQCIFAGTRELLKKALSPATNTVCA